MMAEVLVVINCHKHIRIVDRQIVHELLDIEPQKLSSRLNLYSYSI